MTTKKLFTKSSTPSVSKFGVDTFITTSGVDFPSSMVKTSVDKYTVKVLTKMFAKFGAEKIAEVCDLRLSQVNNFIFENGITPFVEGFEHYSKESHKILLDSGYDSLLMSTLKLALQQRSQSGIFLLSDMSVKTLLEVGFKGQLIDNIHKHRVEIVRLDGVKMERKKALVSSKQTVLILA